jgi:Fe2+ or Zn2+ uptake regulation protein
MIRRSGHTPDAPPSAEATLRASGLRSTMPRRVILEVVRATDSHPTAASVFERVRRRLPRVSLATVYRNLRQLRAKGLLQEQVEATGLLRFDPNVEPHDHLTCLECGRIFDLPRRDAGPRGRAELLHGERARAPTRMGFQVLDCRVELYGRCRECRGRDRRPAESRGGKLGNGRPRASRTAPRGRARAR